MVVVLLIEYIVILLPLLLIPSWAMPIASPQEREGLPLAEAWSEGGKTKQIITKLGEVGALSQQEVQTNGYLTYISIYLHNYFFPL